MKNEKIEMASIERLGDRSKLTIRSSISAGLSQIDLKLLVLKVTGPGHLEMFLCVFFCALHLSS